MIEKPDNKPGEQPGRPKDRTALQAQIDENLRRAYDAVLSEEVPDRFRDLLARLQGGDPSA